MQNGSQHAADLDNGRDGSNKTPAMPRTGTPKRSRGAQPIRTCRCCSNLLLCQSGQDKQTLCATGILSLLRNLKHSSQAASPPSRRVADQRGSRGVPASDTDFVDASPQSMTSSPVTPRGSSPLHRVGLPLRGQDAPPRPATLSEQQGSQAISPGRTPAQPLSDGAQKARLRSQSYPQSKPRLDANRTAVFAFSPASPEQVVRFPVTA